MVHGGDSGEINFGLQKQIQTSERYIFNCTLAENRALEPSFQLPTLNEVIKLLNRKVFINIELKVPYSEEDRKEYDWRKAVKILH